MDSQDDQNKGRVIRFVSKANQYRKESVEAGNSQVDQLPQSPQLSQPQHTTTTTSSSDTPQNSNKPLEVIYVPGKSSTMNSPQLTSTVNNGTPLKPNNNEDSIMNNNSDDDVNESDNDKQNGGLDGQDDKRKRTRKFVEMEDEEYIDQSSTPPITANKPGDKLQRINQGDVTVSNGPPYQGRGRPKKQVPLDDGDDVDEDGKKGKNKKKNQPNQLDIRPCWFAGCTKADRSLKILRPCLIPTCKTHAIKSEVRIGEALGRGFCLEEKAGQKDTVCGICGDSLKPLVHCANDDCAFAYCPQCIEIIVSKHGNAPPAPGATLPGGAKWVCWVCNAVKMRGKERERTRWVREARQPNAIQLRKQRLPKADRDEMSTKRVRKSKEGADGQPQPTQNGPGRPRGRKKSVQYESNQDDSQIGASVPGSPTTNIGANQENEEFVYQSIMSPEREPISPVDFFIDQAFQSIKFYNSLLKNPTEEMNVQFKTMLDTITRLRTVRWSNDYNMVWRSVEGLGLLFKRNLQSSQTILSMQPEIKQFTEQMMKFTNNNTRNLPMERAISRVYEHHEISNYIERECSAARNVMVIAIDNAIKMIEEMHQNLQQTVEVDAVTESRVTRELEQLEEQLKSTVVELDKIKLQELELVEKLSNVRSTLSTMDSIRDSLTKRCNELKIEALLSKNNVVERESDVKVKEAALENEMSALNSLITLIEGVYWGHEFFYSTEVGECERIVSEKIIDLNNKIDFNNNDIPLALALKRRPGKSAIVYEEPSADGNNNNATSTGVTTTGTVTNTAQNGENVSFLNPFKTLCIYHTACMEHNVPEFHLEKPDRIRVAIQTINEYVNRYPGVVEVFNTPPEVEQRYVMAVHDAHYIKKLETSLPPEGSDFETHLDSDHSGAMITVTQRDGEDDGEVYDTFVSHRSMKAALRASGAVCSAVDAVSKLGYSRAFCAIRPPGHHAGRFGRTSDAPSQGYCLINNVAIGAKYASFTAGYSRIAVVDFDVHHGNGTQEILSGDENFLFISIHVCDEKRYFYPGTGRDEGEMTEDGKYEGNVLNVGMKVNSGSQQFLQAWKQKIIPRLEAYQPQLIFLSAGFDGHKDDPTNGLKLNEEDYYTITKMMKMVAAKYSSGRIISVLEGGYGIEKSNSLQRCLNAHLKALVEDDNNEILYQQSSSGDFSLSKKLYNGSVPTSIRDPSRLGDAENISIYNNISKDYRESLKSNPLFIDEPNKQDDANTSPTKGAGDDDMSDLDRPSSPISQSSPATSDDEMRDTQQPRSTPSSSNPNSLLSSPAIKPQQQLQQQQNHSINNEHIIETTNHQNTSNINNNVNTSTSQSNQSTSNTQTAPIIVPPPSKPQQQSPSNQQPPQNFYFHQN